ncbi:hypothetical protein BDV98DRAFT_90582 [Pterulicium gracile]|uniref:Uncharacterized protein n=1 Tax=Pterulicium gracile TaxID=1884261 RepID=A0A5C3QRZ6_9AGAR|nr:hypothetical protein BDV98DRAFT_90582 [Pterula gracilis]
MSIRTIDLMSPSPLLFVLPVFCARREHYSAMKHLLLFNLALSLLPLLCSPWLFWTFRPALPPQATMPPTWSTCQHCMWKTLLQGPWRCYHVSI